MSGYVPRVTVGIPIYRGEKFILHAINSIRQDPFAEWEILIFDDHSPDSSRSVVEGLHDSRIRIIGSPVNRGLVYARNQIFAESRGEYVAWLDQDDLSHRGRLLAQVNFLDDRPAVSLSVGWSDILTDGPKGALQGYTKVLPISHADLRAHMLFQNPISCSTVMMRKADFQNLRLGFRRSFGNTLDYDLWSRASDHLRFEGLERSLAGYRIHPEQASAGREVDVMSRQALNVQIELLRRSLDLDISAADVELHLQLASMSKVQRDASFRERACWWLARIRKANLRRRSFEQLALDSVLAQKWMATVGAETYLSPMERSTVFLSGLCRMGVSIKGLRLAWRNGRMRQRYRKRDVVWTTGDECAA